jgi:tmRNA-binding protein
MAREDRRPTSERTRGPSPEDRLVAQNRRAGHDYFIL